MAAMRERGLSLGQIARAIGCSESWVNWKCLQMGADHPGAKELSNLTLGPAVCKNGTRRFTADEDAKIVALEKQGANPAQIGRQLGRSRGSVLARLMTLARHEARRDG
jgi:hypothetical protein